MTTTGSQRGSITTKLDSDDLFDICESLYKARDKYKFIGLGIGVEISTIDAIVKKHNDPNECLLEILSVHLRKTPSLTWADIIKTLKSRLVGEHRVAEEIEKRLENESRLENKGENEAGKGEGGRGGRGIAKSRENEFENEEVKVGGGRRGRGEKAKPPMEGCTEESKKSSDDEVSNDSDTIQPHYNSSSISKSVKRESKSTGEQPHIVKALTSTSRDASESHVAGELEKGEASVSDSMFSCNNTLVATETAQLQADFVTIVAHTKCYLLEREASSQQFLASFKAILVTLPLSKKHCHLCFLQEKKPLIKKAVDVDEIFDIIEPYLNYVDYNFLEYRILEFGNNTLQKEMEVYISAIETFEKKTSINEALQKDDNSIPPYFAEITLKLDEEPGSFSLYQARFIKNIIIARSSLEGYTVYMRARPSSVLITIAFPPKVLNDVRSVFTETFITTHNVIFISTSAPSPMSVVCKPVATAVPEIQTGGLLERVRAVDVGEDVPGDDEESDSDIRDLVAKKEIRRSPRDSLAMKGDSSSSSSQDDNQDTKEERKESSGSGRVSRERKMREEEKNASSSFDTDDSSPENEMFRTLRLHEKRQLKERFECLFGRLCCEISDPVRTAAQLQEKRLISSSMMEEMLTSPESSQEKKIKLVKELQKKLKLRPDIIFTVIKIFLHNEALQGLGNKLWIKACTQ